MTIIICIASFLSTLSLRRATGYRQQNQRQNQFLSTLSLRRATVDKVSYQYLSSFLSTLSLRRATKFSCFAFQQSKYFYPRSPCGERHDSSALMKCQVKFLSTLSLRRATCAGSQQPRGTTNFYPRSPCGERHSVRPHTRRRGVISIHALLAESDLRQAISPKL